MSDSSEARPMKVGGRCRPDVIEVGPSVRLFNTKAAAIQFGVTLTVFEAALVALGVPVLVIDGERFFNLFALELVFFSALRPSGFRAIDFSGDAKVPPVGSSTRLLYLMNLASLTFSAATTQELEARIMAMAKLLRKRAKNVRFPFGSRQRKSD